MEEKQTTNKKQKRFIKILTIFLIGFFGFILLFLFLDIADQKLSLEDDHFHEIEHDYYKRADEVSNMREMRRKIIIEDSSWTKTWDNFGRRSIAKGEVTIANNSAEPVDFIILEITYYDTEGDIVNSDATYAIEEFPLRAGQKRNIGWTTENCLNCERASYELVFE